MKDKNVKDTDKDKNGKETNNNGLDYACRCHGIFL